MYIKGISVITLCDMYEDGEIDFNADMQRGEVWSNQKRSLYIHSILMGISEFQSPFLVGKGNDNVLRILDGKQRGTTLVRFCNGEFRLSIPASEPPIYLDGEEVSLSGKRFDQLPKKLQRKITNTNINLAIMENASPELEGLIFRRFNNGKAMTNFDIARSYKNNLEDINEICEHEIFKVMFSKNALKRLSPQDIIVKTWIVLFEEETNFSPKHVLEVMKNLVITPDQKQQIEEFYSIIFEAYKIVLNETNENTAKIMLNKGHLLTYICYIEKFDSAEQLAEFIIWLLNNMPEDYKQLSEKGHTTGASVIKAKNKLMEKMIDDFLSKRN